MVDDWDYLGGKWPHSMGNNEYIIYNIAYSGILYLCKYTICVQYTYLSITYSLYLDMCGLVLMGFIFVGGLNPITVGEYTRSPLRRGIPSNQAIMGCKSPGVAVG